MLQEDSPVMSPRHFFIPIPYISKIMLCIFFVTNAIGNRNEIKQWDEVDPQEELFQPMKLSLWKGSDHWG